MKTSHFQEIQPERDVSGNNFAKGQININWTMDNSSYFNPYQSFLKIRFRLYKREDGDSLALERSDSIAPSMFLADNLFQQVSMHINNEMVSDISDYVGTVSALKRRMSFTEEKMNNYLQTTNFSQAYLDERICDLTNDSTYPDQFEYLIFENQAGDISIVAATGVLNISPGVGNENKNDDLDVGDTILVEGVPYTIVDSNGDGLQFEVFPRPNANINNVDDGVWSFWRKRPTINKLKCRGINTYECIWRPAIGFFDVDDFIPGCSGLFNLRLTPHPDGTYQKTAVETNIIDGVTHGASDDVDADYVFSIESINMYLLKGVGPPITSKTISLNLMETRCQTQNLTTTSLHQKTFQVHPKTHALTLAYQYSGAGISTNEFIQSKLRAKGNDERKLTRFWISYGGKQLPTPIPDTLYDTDTAANKRDYFTQRYVESIKYSNNIDSPEPLHKWFERGPYYHFSGYDAENKEERVFVSSQFSGANFTDNINPNVVLFDHFMKKVDIVIGGSTITNVKVS